APSQRRHSNVVRPPYARLEHSPAPNWNRVLHADGVHLPGAPMSSHTPQLDVDNPASAQPNRSFRMEGIMNALVEADCRSKLSLQQGMLIDIVPGQRLLNHQQLIFIERFESIHVCQSVRRVGID